MARSDLLLDLVRAGSAGDQPRFKRVVEAIVAEERAKQHHVLAERLSRHLIEQPVRPTPIKGTGINSAHEVLPQRRLAELLLPKEVARTALEVVEEHHRVELLRSHGLEPRHRVLLTGPPGNGKTSLAEALAAELGVPLLVARYEALVASYLGETTVRVAQLFEYARSRRCVLFFDEFDVVGKERGDVHETGEIKRVVSSLLLQVDAVPAHVVIVAATNHPELLDRAVWRRFQVRLDLPPPGRGRVAEFFQRVSQSWGRGLGLSPRTLANGLTGLSYSELDEFAMDLKRRYVLALPDADLRAIARQCMATWQGRIRDRPE